jgi:glycosyltransferase involved in cell wall biosynthesis
MSISPGLHLGIDATNIRQGGGITHLSQLLLAADPRASGIDKVTIWACKATAETLPERSWLTKRSAPWMEAGLLRRSFGQQVKLPREIREAACEVAFFPGGTVPRRISAQIVTMSQNMLPFEPDEAAHFGRWSAMRLKMRVLRHVQGRSFQRSHGIVFLTRYAESTVTRVLGGLSAARALIPHGIEERFLQPPRRPRPLAECTTQQPFRVLYVSILMPYKHQVEVALAADRLRAEGIPIEMRFIGAPWGRYGHEFRQLIQRIDPKGEFLLWTGAEPFSSLHHIYQASDAFVFASSCENLPNILIEAMAAGLPIASSSRGPMPEVLGSSGVYFEPEAPESIAMALKDLMSDTSLRAKLAEAAWRSAAQFSWERCARETFEFIANVAREKRHELASVTQLDHPSNRRAAN